MKKASLFFFLMPLVVVQCTPKSIFLLAGQSNMVGEGGVNLTSKTPLWDGIIPPDCRSSPQILRLNNDSLWEEAREPLHQGIGQTLTSGVGPGMPFANSILKPGETIGLVPCAVSGTPIREWMRGTANYNRTLARARATLSNGGGSIRALLWYQGEADMSYLSIASSYKANLVHLFNDLLNDLHSPSLPIIQVALASGLEFRDVVREGQLKLGLVNVYCVDALKLNNLTLEDQYHLNTQTQVNLGKELAKVYNNVSGLTSFFKCLGFI